MLIISGSSSSSDTVDVNYPADISASALRYLALATISIFFFLGRVMLHCLGISFHLPLRIYDKLLMYAYILGRIECSAQIIVTNSLTAS